MSWDRREVIRGLVAAAGGVAATASGVGASGLLGRAGRVPGLSIGFHNPGYGDPYFAAALHLQDRMDLVRISPRFVRDEGVPTTEVSPSDQLLAGLDAFYGPDRLLYLVNDRDDNARPTVSGMLSSLSNTLDVWPVRFVQVGNEEGNFGGLTPESYADLLLEARAFLASRSPATRVVSSAWFGQESGIPETHRFMDVVDQRGGPERFFDILAVHDYTEGFNVEQHVAKRTALGWSHVPIWVTEANTERGGGAQADWLRNGARRIWDALHDDVRLPADGPPQTVFLYQANSAVDVDPPDLPYGRPDRYAVFWFESMSSWGFNSAETAAELTSGVTQGWFAQRTPNPAGGVIPVFLEGDGPGGGPLVPGEPRPRPRPRPPGERPRPRRG